MNKEARTSRWGIAWFVVGLGLLCGGIMPVLELHRISGHSHYSLIGLLAALVSLAPLIYGGYLIHGK